MYADKQSKLAATEYEAGTKQASKAKEMIYRRAYIQGGPFPNSVFPCPKHPNMPAISILTKNNIYLI